MNTKICNTCGNEKNVIEFNKQAKAPDGLMYTCRDCFKEFKQRRAAQYAESRPVIQTKICSKCGLEKLVSEFYRDKRNSDGYIANCKACQYEYIGKKYIKKESTKKKVRVQKFNRMQQYLAEHGIPETKICSKCKQELPVSEFYANRANKDGLYYLCKKCFSDDVAKAKKAPHRAKALHKYNKEYRWWLKTEVFKKYGMECQCPSGLCHENNIKFLTIDHINNDGQIDRKSPDTFYLKLLNEPLDRTKYRVMCWNCNSGRSKNHGICPHEEQQQLIAAEYYT